MNRKSYQFCLIIFLQFAVHQTNIAQRISFGTYASEGIMIQNLVPQGLDFNLAAGGVLVAGLNQTVQVGLMDDEAVVLEIQAQADLDITVEIEIPAFLMLNVSNTIPVSLNWAYSNTGAVDIMTARSQAVTLPSGFQTFTIPVIRRSSGAPGPPPTPSHQGYAAPTGTAYLFIYGNLGPIGNINAGQYDGIINVTVSYTQI
ncbi:MAG: hypothetical protein IPI60_19170 [Saprospiraceae bacterium]|nr:hypothetical protein [Saprospiraceae bacterium]